MAEVMVAVDEDEAVVVAEEAEEAEVAEEAEEAEELTFGPIPLPLLLLLPSPAAAAASVTHEGTRLSSAALNSSSRAFCKKFSVDAECVNPIPESCMAPKSNLEFVRCMLEVLEAAYTEDDLCFMLGGVFGIFNGEEMAGRTLEDFGGCSVEKKSGFFFWSLVELLMLAESSTTLKFP